jgi:hypothetical protein
MHRRSTKRAAHASRRDEHVALPLDLIRDAGVDPSKPRLVVDRRGTAAGT